MQSVKHTYGLRHCPICAGECTAYFEPGIKEEGREEETECNCYFSGDQADASDCPLHRR